MNMRLKRYACWGTRIGIPEFPGMYEHEAEMHDGIVELPDMHEPEAEVICMLGMLHLSANFCPWTLRMINDFSFVCLTHIG